MSCVAGCGSRYGTPILTGRPGSRGARGSRFDGAPATCGPRIARSSGELKATNQDLYAGWLLVEQLRGVYLAHDHDEATALLDDWILAALGSELDPFIRTALTLDVHRDEIANAIVLGLSNARLEGMNSTVRLISHRARGFRRLESLLSMIALVCGRIRVVLPT